jgi:AAA+ ATPase superfamily predicted ATPase
MKIIGRVKERAELQRYYESGRPEFIAVCGRRRVGKTFLIKEHFGNEFTFYFTGATAAPNRRQLKNFDEALYEYGYKENESSDNWFDAFRKLNDLIKQKPAEGRKVIFIDELPWLIHLAQIFWGRSAIFGIHGHPPIRAFC